MLSYLKSIILPIFVLILTFSACNNDEDKKIPDVSNINVTVNLHRFEQDFFKLDSTQLEKSVIGVQQKYPVFYPFFIDSIISIRDPRDTSNHYLKELKGFLGYKPLQELNDTCQIAYKDVANLEKELKQAFQFYKYYFPNATLPEIYTFISEYSRDIVGSSDGKIVAFGLDMFLGQNHPNYSDPLLNIPKFLSRTFNKEHIPAKLMTQLIYEKMQPPSQNRLLDYIIFNGKKLYMLDKILPYTPDSIKLEHPQKQTKWCFDNEVDLWAHFVSNKLLYSSKQEDIRKLIAPSPNAPNMPAEAPGETGNFIGWRIVKSYMQRHPNTTFEELIKINDAQLILDEAKYKPKRK